MSNRTEIRVNRSLLRWVLLGVGLIAFIVALIAFLAVGETGDKTVTWIALAVGVLGVAGFVMLDPEAIVSAVTGRTAAQGAISLLMTVFFLAAVVGGYYILYRLTTDGLIDDIVKPAEYRLSQTTIDQLEALDEPVHVTAFVPVQQEESIRNWLQEYKRYGGENFTYEFVDPDLNPVEAQRLGASTGTIVFEVGDRTATADFADESSLTGALVRVQLGDPRTAYMVTGHGERSLDDPGDTGFAQASSVLERANFTVNPLNLAQQGEVPEDADVVIIAGPTAQFSQSEIDALNAYLSEGGSLLVLADPGQGFGSMEQGVSAIAYSADGDFVATAGVDGTAKIWDEDTGEELTTLRGHANAVVDVAFSPDGSQLVTAGFDGRVIVWSFEGDIVAELVGQTAGVEAVAWSPDGSFIASAGTDQAINVWNAQTFEPMSYSPIASLNQLYAVAFSPDSSMIAVAGGAGGNAPTGTATVYDAASGEEIVNRSIHTNIAFSVVFTPDGSQIKTAAGDGTVGTLELPDGADSSQTLYPDVGIRAMDIDEEGNLVLGLGDGRITVHPADATSAEDDNILTGHEDLILDVAFSPDGREVATASRDGKAIIWNLGQGDPRITLEGHRALDPLMGYLSTDWGIDVGNDLVVDLPSQQYAGSAVNVVILDYDQSSEVTRSLAQSSQQRRTVYPLTRSVSAGVAPEGVTVTPLMLTTAGTDQTGLSLSWAETTDPFASAGAIDFDPADIAGPVSIAASAENAANDARIVVVGDADFVSNQALQATTYDNEQLFINSLNWLTGADAGVEIPPADISAATWDNPFSPVLLFITQVTMACLIPLAFIVIGAIVWFIRRRRR